MHLLSYQSEQELYQSANNLPMLYQQSKSFVFRIQLAGDVLTKQKVKVLVSFSVFVCLFIQNVNNIKAISKLLSKLYRREVEQKMY